MRATFSAAERPRFYFFCVPSVVPRSQPWNKDSSKKLMIRSIEYYFRILSKRVGLQTYGERTRFPSRFHISCGVLSPEPQANLSYVLVALVIHERESPGRKVLASIVFSDQFFQFFLRIIDQQLCKFRRTAVQ